MEDSVWGMVEIQWSFDQFFNEQGTSNFVDRFISVLNIHPSRLKTVGLVEGSVIVEYFITKNNDLTKEELKFELRELNDMIASLY